MEYIVPAFILGRRNTELPAAAYGTAVFMGYWHKEIKTLRPRTGPASIRAGRGLNIQPSDVVQQAAACIAPGMIYGKYRLIGPFEMRRCVVCGRGPRLRTGFRVCLVVLALAALIDKVGETTGNRRRHFELSRTLVVLLAEPIRYGIAAVPLIRQCGCLRPSNHGCGEKQGKEKKKPGFHIVHE